jgi:hypothetical protein
MTLYVLESVENIRKHLGDSRLRKRKLKLSKRGISESKKYQEMKIDENR